MEQLAISPYLLAIFFFFVALLYSSVGLGGGSSYTALLAIFGASHVAIPSISLALNLVVTSIGAFNFIRHRHARFRLILPFLIASIPMAYLGGSLSLPKEAFYWLLEISLIVIVLRIYFWERVSLKLSLGETQKILVSLAVGGLLGFIAGAVGIGGGIYLVPLIIILGLGTPQQAAACGVIFIWVNSLAGLMARIQFQLFDFSHLLPLIIAVLAGGGLGSYLGATKLAPRTMEKWLGAIILIAIVLLGRKILSLAP